MKMSKKGVICTMWCTCLFPAVAAMAEDVVIKAGDLRITYVENGKQFNVGIMAGRLTGPYSWGRCRRLRTTSMVRTVSVSVRLRARRPTTRKRTVNDAFGRGRAIRLSSHRLPVATT